MTVRARAGLLAALTLGGALLGGGPAHAVPAEAVPLFEAGLTDRPQELYPLSQTAAGLVYTVVDQRGVWIQPAEGDAVYEEALRFPVVVGDMLESYDPFANSVDWRTIADPTITTHEIPAGLQYKTATASGYLGVRGDGPYDLVSVDLLDGGTETVFGTTDVQYFTLVAGPLGALGSTGMFGGETRYFPYDTPGSGTVIPTPDMCSAVTAGHSFCQGISGMTRRPLAGGAGVTATGDPYYVIATSTGVAYAAPSAGDSGQHTLRTWASASATSTQRLDTTFGLTGAVGPTTVGDAVLVTRGGDLGEAGIWSVPIPSGSPTMLVEAQPQDRAAASVALAPGSVAWVDNEVEGNGVWTRDLDAAGDPAGEPRLVASNASGAALSVGAGRFTYAEAAPFGAGGTRLVDGEVVTQIDDGAEDATLSGDRLLTRTYSDAGATVWRLRDLRTGAVTTLPSALDYDLWGDRLVRLRTDGAVLVADLRTGAAAVEVRGASPAPYLSGSVHLAGDTVAWEVYAGETHEVAARDVVTMEPAVPLTGLNGLTDLSTGYAIGAYCSEVDCPLSAVALDDQEVTTIADVWTGDVDGNTAAYVGADGVPAVVELPVYADAPRLLAAPRAGTQAGFGRTWTARVVTSRVLTSCAVEILDADDSVVRTLDCVDPHAATTVTWDGTDEDGAVVPVGAYDWRIVGATGAEDLVDHDGSSDALAGTLTVSDNPVPTVTTRFPTVDGTSVAATANVTATFSEAVAGVTGTTFQVRPEGGSPVAALVTYSPTSRTATLNPSAGLLPDADYVATLTGGASAIRDGADGPLETTSWTFTTGPAPTVTGTSPATSATAVTSTANVIAAFSEPVTGVDGTTVTLKVSGGGTVPAAVAYNSTTAKVTLNPSTGLAPDTQYTATLTGGASGITDAAGNPLVTRSWSFTTGPAPTVTAKTPAVNATGVSRTANVVAAFSEAVQGIRSTTAVLRTSSGKTVTAVASYSTASRKVTINPSATLAAKTKYTVSLLGGATTIRDGANNPLATTTWSFTTGS